MRNAGIEILDESLRPRHLQQTVDPGALLGELCGAGIGNPGAVHLEVVAVGTRRHRLRRRAAPHPHLVARQGRTGRGTRREANGLVVRAGDPHGRCLGRTQPEGHPAVAEQFRGHRCRRPAGGAVGGRLGLTRGILCLRSGSRDGSTRQGGGHQGGDVS